MLISYTVCYTLLDMKIKGWEGKIRKDAPHWIKVDFCSYDLNITVIERFLKSGYTKELENAMTIDEYNWFVGNLEKFQKNRDGLLEKYGV